MSTLFFQRRPKERITKTKISPTNDDMKKVKIQESTAALSPSKSLSPEPSTSLYTKRSLEESLDVFASTSSEAENSKLLPPEASVIDLSISDDEDSDTDVKLKAATGKACEHLKTTPSSSNKAAQQNKVQAKTPRKNAAGVTSPGVAKPRQRTLLEMLDQTYNQITGPATKRYCVSKSPSQKQQMQQQQKPQVDHKE